MAQSHFKSSHWSSRLSHKRNTRVNQVRKFGWKTVWEERGRSRKNVMLKTVWGKWRQIAVMIYDYFRVTGAHEAVLSNSMLADSSREKPGSENMWHGSDDPKSDGSSAQQINCCWVSQDQVIWVFRGISVLEKRAWRSQKQINTLQWQLAEHWVTFPDCHLRQLDQYPRNSRGNDVRIISWSHSSGEIRCSKSTGQSGNYCTTSSCRNATQWRATRKLASRIRTTIWKIVRRPKSCPNCVPKQVWDQSKLNNSFMCFRHREEKENQSFRENIRCLEIKKELVPQGRSKAMCDFILCRT